MFIFDHNGSDRRRDYGLAHFDTRKVYFKIGTSEDYPGCQFQPIMQSLVRTDDDRNIVRVVESPNFKIANIGTNDCMPGYADPSFPQRA